MKKLFRTRLENIAAVLLVISVILLQACGNTSEEKTGNRKTVCPCTSASQDKRRHSGHHWLRINRSGSIGSTTPVEQSA